MWAFSLDSLVDLGVITNPGQAIVVRIKGIWLSDSIYPHKWEVSKIKTRKQVVHDLACCNALSTRWSSVSRWDFWIRYLLILLLQNLHNSTQILLNLAPTLTSQLYTVTHPLPLKIYEVATCIHNAILGNCLVLMHFSQRSLHMLCSLLGVLSLSPCFRLQCRKDPTQEWILSASNLDHSDASGSGAVHLIPMHYMYKRCNYLEAISLWTSYLQAWALSQGCCICYFFY